MDKLVKIESVLKESSGRFLSDAQLQPDPLLVAEGWERRFTIDEQRTTEVLELYTQLGYEVRSEPLNPGELQDHCHDCQSSVSRLRAIYTRKR